MLEEAVFLAGGKNKEYFVLSFSNCRDSITMWSEFGSKTGYNIGLDSEKIVQRIGEANVIDYHGFVIYDPELQKRLIRKIISDYLPEIFQTPFERILEAGEKNPEDPVYRKACRKFQKIAAVYAMFFKHEAFKEEQESRFISQILS